MGILSREDSGEVLEVDKVYNKDHNHTGELYDSLYVELKTKFDNEEEANKEDTAKEDNTESSTKNNTDNVEGDNDAEAMSKELSSEETISQEDWESFKQSSKEGIITGLVYLKEIGVNYGPVVLKTIGKGTLNCVIKLARSLVKGTETIAKYYAKKINAFKVLNSQIDDLRAAYELCKHNNKEIKHNIVYNNRNVINGLKIGSSVDFNKNIDTAMIFTKLYLQEIDKEIMGITASISRTISNVVEGHEVSPNLTTTDKYGFPFLELGIPAGYNPPDSNLEGYHYKSILPGDINFMAYGPTKSLQSKEDITAAMHGSKFFMGESSTRDTPAPNVILPPLVDIGEIIRSTDALCKLCLAREARIPIHIKARNNLKGRLSLFIKTVMFAKGRKNDYDMLSDYIYSKMMFMDKTYINGEIIVHDLANRIIRYSIEYCRFALKNTIDTTP